MSQCDCISYHIYIYTSRTNVRNDRKFLRYCNNCQKIRVWRFWFRQPPTAASRSWRLSPLDWSIQQVDTWQVMFKHRRSWKWLTAFQYISTHNTKMTVFQYISTPSKGWCKLFTRWHRIKKDGEGKSACSTCWACFLDHWIGWNLEGCTTTISRWYPIVGVIFGSFSGHTTN